MFTVTIGDQGRLESWQEPFPPTTECVHCQGEARFAFTAFEDRNRPGVGHWQNFVKDMHKNDPDGKGFWLHDCCAVAVYFCKVCGKPTALYNQA